MQVAISDACSKARQRPLFGFELSKEQIQCLDEEPTSSSHQKLSESWLRVKRIWTRLIKWGLLLIQVFDGDSRNSIVFKCDFEFVILGIVRRHLGKLAGQFANDFIELKSVVRVQARLQVDCHVVRIQYGRLLL